ncbi:hypothetical protein, partial [Klebsiella pneumoniae]|uniref:hypothetical protein n=1 Tax=Klebsiella pneumoniae TaxID=573 RepID=UPI0032167263
TPPPLFKIKKKKQKKIFFINFLFIKKNQKKIVFAWGVVISGMRTESRFSGVSAELLSKKHSTQSEMLCNSGCTEQGLFIS